MTWEMVLAGMERAHPCMCGESIEAFDRKHFDNLRMRVQTHLRNCPKYKMLTVILAALAQLPEQA